MLIDTGKKKPKPHKTPTKPSSPPPAANSDADIGAFVKAHRKWRELSLMQLAEITGIGHGNLSKIENGKQGLTNETMQLLADAFEISLSELFQNPDKSSETETSIIAALNQTGPGIKHARPVRYFKKLKDIPHGEIVLIDGVKVIADAGQGEQRWKVDKENQHVVLGNVVRDLDSNPANLAVHIVADDAMTPRLFKDDHVIIDTGETTVPSIGGVFAITLDNQPVEIRRLFPKVGNGLTIACDNTQYPTTTLSADERAFINIIGRVKTRWGSNGF